MLPPAFVGGMPGGMEFTIILLVSLAIPILLLVAAVRYFDRGSSNDLEERVANLEGQVAALREELREREE